MTKTLCKILFVTVFLQACSSTATKTREPSPQEAEQRFSQAQNLARSANPELAIKPLEELLRDFGNTSIGDRSAFVLAQIYSAQPGQEARALELLKVVHSSPYKSPLVFSALIKSARIQLKMGDLVSAEKSFLRAQSVAETERDRDVVTQLLIRFYLSQNQNLLALDQMAPFKASDASRAIDVIESRLSESELERVAQRTQFGKLRAHAFFRLGEIHFEKNLLASSRSFLERTIDLAQDTELAMRAKDLILQIDSLRTVAPMTLGAVLPITGKNSAVGERSLRSLQLGLGIYGNTRSPIRLAVVDSQGNPDVARRGVEKLVLDHNVIGIVGSLMSKTASSVAQKANEMGVPSIGISQLSDVTLIGDSVFRSSITAEVQMRALATFAIQNMGFKRFAILYPNDAFGTRFAELFWREVDSLGGEVRAAQSYTADLKNVSEPIQRLLGQFYIEDRLEDLNEIKRQRLELLKRPNRRGGLPNVMENLSPRVDFDAIFIPDGPRALSQISPLLKYSDAAGITLLGPNIWNTPEFVQRLQAYNHYPNLFLDGYFVDQKMRNSDFYRTYQGIFGTEPSQLDLQAYEVGLILRQTLLSLGPSASRVELRNALARLRDFPVVGQTVSFDRNRELTRNLIPMTATASGVQTLNPSKKN